MDMVCQGKVTDKQTIKEETHKIRNFNRNQNSVVWEQVLTCHSKTQTTPRNEKAALVPKAIY